MMTFCVGCGAMAYQKAEQLACVVCPPEGVELVAELRSVVAGMSDDEARAFWKRLASIGDEDLLDPNYPTELVDADLRELGLDPEALTQRGAEFVRGLMRERER